MTMTDLLNPRDCHARALTFSKRAATCASPKAESVFANIAKNWIALAFQLETGGTLSDHGGHEDKKAILKWREGRER
jgi:hypothetical protein